MNPPFEVFSGDGAIVATAIHAGHDLRPEVAVAVALDEATRRREEDPHTDLLADVVDSRVVVYRSRFEVDLNRPRDEAIYLTTGQAWGLEVWKEQPSAELVEGSLAVYDSFYGAMKQVFDQLEGRFVVLDVHSYNHRRQGPKAPAEPSDENPDVNLGTGSVDRPVWNSLIERFSQDLISALPSGSTFAENLKFRGGHFARWINESYTGRGCALAIEFKKTFVDEWTDQVDASRLAALRQALAATIPGLTKEVG